jgi:hypothetical protein
VGGQVRFYSEGMPVEWRITTMYIAAIAVGALLIILAIYDSRSGLATEVDELRQSIRDHQAAECASLGYYKPELLNKVITVIEGD